MKRLLIAALFLALTAAAPSPVDTLARDVARAESVRAVKDVQRLYAQYAQFGLWTRVSGLFAPRATFTLDGQIKPAETAAGAQAIAALLRSHYGDGHEGLRPGDIRTLLIDTPIISLSPDGNSARGRWYLLALLGGGGKARIEGGTFENDYIRQGGTWKIAAVRYYPQYAGPYESGWRNWGGGDLPIVPYHFTPDSAGVPIPPPTGPAPRSSAGLGALSQRIAALNDEDAVRNLQSAYGYYVDRKMWDDVTDLFTADGTLHAGGTWRGARQIRRWLETMGPAGLTHGQLNDHPQFDTIVTISPDGQQAWARGIELGMLGEADQEKGWWEASVFRNRFVKSGGVWKIREMQRASLWKADYYKGWGKDLLHERRGPAPAFLAKAKPAAGGTAFTLAKAKRRLSRSTAYDAVENVSGAYTAYLDDYQSDKFGALVADKGFKMSAFAGYYIGRDRVTEAGMRVWGKPPVTRPGVHFHWRVQPVILVAADGRSANLRIRLFQPRTAKEPGKPGDFISVGFSNGMYHDQFVLERGAWRFWNLSLDEPYVSLAGWDGGWAKAKDPPPPRPGASASVLTRAGSDFPPDVPVTALGKRQEHFRGGTGEPWQWPQILPMWFEYRNPVSGRVPELFQESCAPCAAAPQLRLDRNGYLEPPDGPVKQ